MILSPKWHVYSLQSVQLVDVPFSVDGLAKQSQTSHSMKHVGEKESEE